MVKIDLEKLSVDIFDRFNEFCMNFNITDMKKEPQNVFRASLKYIGSKVFTNKDMLKSKEMIKRKNCKYPTTNNTYDFDLLLNIYYIYENLCYLNNKEISFIDFGYITNIPYNSIMNWCNRLNKGDSSLNPSCRKLIEIIYSSKEASIEGSGKADLITMAKLNHYFDWNVQGIKSTNDDAKAISVNELRERLGLDVKE